MSFLHVPATPPPLPPAVYICTGEVPLHLQKPPQRVHRTAAREMMYLHPANRFTQAHMFEPPWANSIPTPCISTPRAVPSRRPAVHSRVASQGSAQRQLGAQRELLGKEIPL